MWKYKVVDNKFFWTDSTSKIGSNEKAYAARDIIKFHQFPSFTILIEKSEESRHTEVDYITEIREKIHTRKNSVPWNFLNQRLEMRKSRSWHKKKLSLLWFWIIHKCIKNHITLKQRFSRSQIWTCSWSIKAKLLLLMRASQLVLRFTIQTEKFGLPWYHHCYFVKCRHERVWNREQNNFIEF